jgi:hypothetical protein
VQDLIDCLVQAGQNPDTIYSVANEVAAAHKAIDLAAPGDLVLLIVHEDRTGVMAALHELGATLA